MTSATILCEFIRFRPALEAFVTKIARDPFKAPELKRELIGMAVAAALENTSDTEREVLDRAKGLPAVDWDDVVMAFDTRFATR